jgi:hypothetical protein
LVHNNFIFLIKVQGKNKIPDYVQLRDENYKLMAYFRADRPEKTLVKCGFENHISKFVEIINNMPFGRMTKISLL